MARIRREFTLEERLKIEKLLKDGYEQQHIAMILDRRPQVIYKEVKRGKKTMPDGERFYSAQFSQQSSYGHRRKEGELARKIDENNFKLNEFESKLLVIEEQLQILFDIVTKGIKHD